MESINWPAFYPITELGPYFTDHPDAFKQRIIQYLVPLQAIAPDELDNLALLRVLEVTNGCLQWAFRRHDENCLSVEQTRDCMQMVIGFIKDKQIRYPNGHQIHFSPAIEQLIEDGTHLYRQAFKHHQETAKEEYYAYSTAQFIAYGGDRLSWAEAEVKTHFTDLFSPYFIDRGQRYLKPYLDALTAPHLPEIPLTYEWEHKSA